MILLAILVAWALRSSVLIAVGALLIHAFRVKDPAVRLAVWIAILCASLAIPVIASASPRWSVVVWRSSVAEPAVFASNAPSVGSVHEGAPALRTRATRVRPPDWASLAMLAYALVAVALLLRLLIGIWMSTRIRRASTPAAVSASLTEGIEIRESNQVTSPVTLGVVRPVIVLPRDWGEWPPEKLNAVLAHEASHVRRRDPAVQLLSALHRIVLWHTPASWSLHSGIVRAAEDASDDAALAVTPDRALYAEILLSFMRRGISNASLQGIPMARYAQPEKRIYRILEGSFLSRGVTRRAVAAIVAATVPLAWTAAAADPVSRITLNRNALAAASAGNSQAPGRAESQAQQNVAPGELLGLGTVTPFYTVTIKPRVDGQLLSLPVNEGQAVQQGQLIATVDPAPYELQVNQAQGQLAADKAQLDAAKRVQSDPVVRELEPRIQADQAALDAAKLQLGYTRILSPIAGIAGLRQIDPGNMVHASDPGGIIVITQLQPMAVIFTIPEDQIPVVRGAVNRDGVLTAEAWSRDMSVKLATGRLIAIDNIIDVETGTVKLKATFDNSNNALYPNQFVNMRLRLR